MASLRSCDLSPGYGPTPAFKSKDAALAIASALQDVRNIFVHVAGLRWLKGLDVSSPGHCRAKLRWWISRN